MSGNTLERALPSAQAGWKPAVQPVDALAEVASRYAVAITPAMDALIDPTNPD
jgi:hypothetical protein